MTRNTKVPKQKAKRKIRSLGTPRTTENQFKSPLCQDLEDDGDVELKDAPEDEDSHSELYEKLLTGAHVLSSDEDDVQTTDALSLDDSELAHSIALNQIIYINTTRLEATLAEAEIEEYDRDADDESLHLGKSKYYAWEQWVSDEEDQMLYHVTCINDQCKINIKTVTWKLLVEKVMLHIPDCVQDIQKCPLCEE